MAPYDVRATCRGSTAVRDLGYDRSEGWWCSCGGGQWCPHLVALQLVVDTSSWRRA